MEYVQSQFERRIQMDNYFIKEEETEDVEEEVKK
jgi:hypothetical protein